MKAATRAGGAGEREGARRRLGVTAHGGGKVERWWQRGRTAAVWRDGGGAKGRRRRDGIESGGGGVKGEVKQRPAARARDIYDRWARDFS